MMASINMFPVALDAMLDQDWWPQIVAAHLTAEDALAFSASCRRAKLALSLTLVRATLQADDDAAHL